MHLGNAFKKAMVDSDINTAKELADKADLSYSKVIRLLNNDKSTRIEDAEKLAKTLNLDLNLVDKTGN